MRLLVKRVKKLESPSAAEQTRSPVSDLTGKQVLEFAEQNRGMDEQLDIILGQRHAKGKSNSHSQGVVGR